MFTERSSSRLSPREPSAATNFNHPQITRFFDHLRKFALLRGTSFLEILIMTSEAQIIANRRYARLFTCLSNPFNHFTMIMQNKPNLLVSQINVNTVKTRDYENKSNWTLGENKPNSKPIQTQFIPTEEGSNPKSKSKIPNSPQILLCNLLYQQLESNIWKKSLKIQNQIFYRRKSL